jgi:hypothetical protein
VIKAERKQRDGFSHASQPTTSEAESTEGGGWVRLDPDDLSRFEGEGGPAIPEPVAPVPQETIDAAPSSAAKKCKTMNERRQQYKASLSHRPDVLRAAGLDLAQEGGFEAYDSSYLAAWSRQNCPYA